MDAFVQFVRNALCCVKDLQLFNGTVLHDPSQTALYYRFPPPMDQTTPLEILIAISQFYAFVSITLSGCRLITQSGLWKARRIDRLIRLRSSSLSKHEDPSDMIVDESLKTERKSAARSTWIGINVLAIGLSFFWLFANSLHVTETNWIGGIQGLIHALSVMEVALVPLLYYMIKDGSEQLSKSRRMKALAKTLVSSGGMLSTVGGESAMTAEAYGMIVQGGWSPFWQSAIRWPQNDFAQEEMLLKDEVAKVKVTADALFSSGKGSGSHSYSKASAEVLKRSLSVAAERIEVESWTTRIWGYREYLYFVFNSVAFYGYLLGIVCYYFDDEEIQPTYVSKLKFGYPNSDADWHGNFAGDFMWTVEPVIILASPMLMGWMNPKITKVKKD